MYLFGINFHIFFCVLVILSICPMWMCLLYSYGVNILSFILVCVSAFFLKGEGMEYLGHIVILFTCKRR